MFTCRAFRVDFLILLSEFFMVGLDLNKKFQNGFIYKENVKVKNFKKEL